MSHPPVTAGSDSAGLILTVSSSVHDARSGFGRTDFKVALNALDTLV
jgi:hypothetical protein